MKQIVLFTKNMPHIPLFSCIIDVCGVYHMRMCINRPEYISSQGYVKLPSSRDIKYFKMGI